MTIDRRKHTVGTRDIGRIHTANSGITTQQKRRHAKLGADATRRMMNVKAARHAQEKLGDAHAARTGRQKVAALMQKHKDG